ncbi:MAG: hypothetical protein ACRDG8_11340 [Actinomycetota bacterium]
MDWYRQVQFVSAVPMPPDLADAFGTTVNGMWADPERSSPESVEEAHLKGQRTLFSVPMIALTPRVYEDPAAAYLLNEVCRDIEDGSAECGWYYWESKPVYSVCIYSDAFRAYLMERCEAGVDIGMDVVNLDEIMTSVGLMNRESRGSGFCSRCLDRFRGELRVGEADTELAKSDDEALRSAIRADDGLYERYRRFHEAEAFAVMTGFIQELRAFAAEHNPAFAVSANVGYLGNLVSRFGALWGCLWGPHVDFVLMENDYRVGHPSPHLLLPRGSFAPWYRLGSSFNGAPTWICPSINVPKQLAGEDRRRYYELMFLEAFAYGGRWGYYWWPGVDVQTRLEATAPEVLRGHIRFIAGHRDLYEGSVSMNDVAILYADGPILRWSDGHVKYLALAQALAEAGIQFDVVFSGDGRFNPEGVDRASLERYRTVLIPEARGLGEASTAALTSFARAGGELVVFSESPLNPLLTRTVDGQMLIDFWRTYLDEDRQRIVTSVGSRTSARIECSEPGVGVIRYAHGTRQVFHLLNYRYDEPTDSVDPVRDFHVRIPWTEPTASCTLLTLADERSLASRIDDGELIVDVPELDPYAVLVAAAGPIAAIPTEGGTP